MIDLNIYNKTREIWQGGALEGVQKGGLNMIKILCAIHKYSINIYLQIRGRVDEMLPFQNVCPLVVIRHEPI